MIKGTQRIPLETLRDRISEAVAAHVKSYNIPSFCVALGLEPGESDEAHRSKRLYVKNRLSDLKEPGLLRISADVLKEIDDAALADIVSEMTVHAEHRITEITRRDVLKELNSLDSLFGDVDLFEGLSIVSSERLTHDGHDTNLDSLPSLAKEIERHYVLKNE